MFFLLWAPLLFSVSGSNAGKTARCDRAYCIAYDEGEITAEVGLPVVIPCFFTTDNNFSPRHLVWYQCAPDKRRCSDSDIIFHSNERNAKVLKAGFKGRVSLLEPDVRRRNCSIIINDVIESDSGSYQLRVNGFLDGSDTGYTFALKGIVTVKDLIQKPTVMIPGLTEGQQTTLTCTAPGLFAGSEPKITWMWRGAGEEDSNITGNITAFTENVNAVTQIHRSTLMFNVSAEHHGTEVTCKVIFPNNVTTEETVTLSVTYAKEVQIIGNTTVKEGETLNLTCSVDSFPPSLITWTKSSGKNVQNGTEQNLQTETFTDLQNNTEIYRLRESGMGTFSISNVTAEYSGKYICRAKHLNSTLMESVDVKVIYMKKPVVSGDTTVEKGGALNLTCSVESFPPSLITWTKLGSNITLHNGLGLQNNSGSSTLVIHNVKTEDSGQYICTTQHLDAAVTTYADVTVTWFSEVLNSSGCVVQSEVLTCVCISEGFPLPTIKWPMLKNHTEYSVTTTVSNHTVNSTVTLTVKEHSNTSVECVSSHENGEAKENLSIRLTTPDQTDQSKQVLTIVSRLEVIVAFLIGMLLSAVLCCLAIHCHRKKQKSSTNLNYSLEMLTSQEDPLMDAEDQTYYQEAAEVRGEAVAAEQAEIDLNGGPKDVEYASIDFSVLKRKDTREAKQKQETTEYAEIKRDVKEEQEGSGRDEGNVLDGKDEEETIGEDEETNHFVPEGEEGEEVAVYSNVKDIGEL